MKPLSGLIFIIFTALVAFGSSKAHIYQSGRLIDITSSDEGRGAVLVGNMAVGLHHRRYEIAVQVEDIVYTGEYVAKNRHSYQPSDFVVNDPVLVRFDKERMILLRPKGTEFETKIVKKVRVALSQ